MYPSLDIYSTPVKKPVVGRFLNVPTPRPQISSIGKAKGANIKKKINVKRSHQPKRIAFIEGDESLQTFPPELYNALQQWCTRNKTNTIHIAKSNWGRKDAVRSLYSSEGREAVFVSAEDLSEVPAARYSYGFSKQLMVLRHRDTAFLVLSMQGHACEVTHENGSSWSAMPWYAWEVDRDGHVPNPSQAPFFRLTRRNADDVNGGCKAAEKSKSCPLPQQSPTSKKPFVSEKRPREVDDLASSTIRTLDFGNDSDDEPLAKRLNRMRSISQKQNFPTRPAMSTPMTPSSPDYMTSPATPSPTQFFVFKREITDPRPTRKPVTSITSVRILFKHAEVAEIISDKDDMLMVFPDHGTHIALIRDDHDEFKRLQRIISQMTNKSITKILVLPE